ncbi:MAG: HNH endonuclease signature motif containing protein [Vagococcus fluvialis]
MSIEKFYDKNFIERLNYPKELENIKRYYLKFYLRGYIKNLTSNKHEKNLRYLFSMSVKKHMETGDIPFNSTMKEFHPVTIENAHIVSFAKLVNENTEESIKKAISPYNVLRIDANHHKLFDRHQITFDTKGNLI